MLITMSPHILTACAALCIIPAAMRHKRRKLAFQFFFTICTVNELHVRQCRWMIAVIWRKTLHGNGAVLCTVSSLAVNDAMADRQMFHLLQ